MKENIRSSVKGQRDAPGAFATSVRAAGYISHNISYSVVLESQLLKKIVHLLFTITNQNIKLTVLWGN